MNTRWLLLALMLLGGCSYTPAVIPVLGGESEVAALAGEWQGSYDGGPGGRTGSIFFRLEPVRDTARGDVLMLFDRQQPGRTANRYAPPEGAWQDPGPDEGQLLTVSFVQVEAGRVQGVLDPYSDPETQCLLHTVFTGVRRGDTIEGTFRASCAAAIASEGWWRVERRRARGT